MGRALTSRRVRKLSVVEPLDGVQVLLTLLLPPLQNVRFFFNRLHLVPNSVLEDFVQIRGSLRSVWRGGVTLRV